MMQAMKVSDIPELEPEADTPKYLDPVSENGLIMVGKGVRAYETQDHAAHIKIHQHGAATAAAAQMDPNTQQMIMASYGVHIRDHMALQYRQQIMAAAGIPEPPLDADGEPQELDPQTEALITAAVVAKLPPPPPPPAPPGPAPSPGPDPGQQAIQKDKLDFQQAQQQQTLKAKQDQAAQDKAIKQQAFTEDESRKEQAHQAALRRIEEQTQAESKRKDAMTAADLERSGAKAHLDRTKVLADHKAGHNEAAVAGHLTLREQAAKARQALQAAKEAHDLQMQQAKEKHAAERAAAKAKHATEAKHSAELNRQKRVSGQVGLQQKRQATRIAAKKKPGAK
jgi:hypothetical protein